MEGQYKETVMPESRRKNNRLGRQYHQKEW